jgi:hypothetical protein
MFFSIQRNKFKLIYSFPGFLLPISILIVWCWLKPMFMPERWYYQPLIFRIRTHVLPVKIFYCLFVH